MKKIFAIISLFAIIWSSCEVLDTEPKHSIPADEAISTQSDVIRAINGCYDAFQDAGYYGRNFIAVSDLSTDNLIWSGTTAGYNQIDNNSILADNVIVEGIWASIYRALNRINNVIDRIPDVDVEEISDEKLSEYLAEMYFLRALAHYDLMRYFGGIPLRMSSVSPTEEELNIPRASVDEVFKAILDDIQSAEPNMVATAPRGKASMPALMALKARVTLHRYYVTNNTDYLNTAIEASNWVIDEAGFELETDFADLFTGNNNRESVFEIEFNDQDRNRLAEYFMPTALSGRYEFAPDSTLVDAFSANDVRLDASINHTVSDPHAIKYHDIETGTDNVYVFRLAELYLIRAEANALLGAEATLIEDDINAIRERAGLTPFSSNDHDVLLQEIENQRRLEFAFEGHRWFDLVRTGRAVDVLEGITNINQTLFPIPLNEILANDAIGNDDQNPGY